MNTYQHQVFPVRLEVAGKEYYLAALVSTGSWKDVDFLGDQGWEFVAFVPNKAVSLNGTTRKSQFAVFRRQVATEPPMETRYAKKIGRACA